MRKEFRNAGQALGVVPVLEKLEDMLPSRGLGSGLAGATDVVLAMVTVETAIWNVVVAGDGAELESELDAARPSRSRRLCSC